MQANGQLTGIVALRARLAGLGLATALALAGTSVASATAVAEEADDLSAGLEQAASLPEGEAEQEEMPEEQPTNDGVEATATDAEESDVSEGTTSESAADEGDTSGGSVAELPDEPTTELPVIQPEGDAADAGSGATEVPEADTPPEAGCETEPQAETVETVETIGTAEDPEASEGKQVSSAGTVPATTAPAQVSVAAARTATATAPAPVPSPAKASPSSEGTAAAENNPKPTTGWWTDDATGATYYYKDGKQLRGWVTTALAISTNEKGASKLYWLDRDGLLARDRVINPLLPRDKVKGVYYAYATKDGSIATGAHRVGTRIYVADATGRLAALKGGKKYGWLVTSKFAGSSKRYFLYRDATGDDKGVCFAKPGFSRKGYAHYTLNAGYVLTQTKKVGSRLYIANSKGRMAAPKKAAKRGWLRTSAFGNGKQRYYLYRATSGTYEGGYFAKKGFSTNGYPHYTTKKGYVKTGTFKKNNRIYVTNSRGRIMALPKGKKKGWKNVTGYGNGSQRYYLYRSGSGADKGVCYAVEGVSKDGYRHYTTKKGYVLRSTDAKIGSTWYTANDKGRLSKAVLAPYFRKAQGYGSPTGWLILVDNSIPHTYIFKGSQGNWSLQRSWTCTTGGAASPTVKGVFHVGSRGYSFGHGYTCYWWTQFYEDYLFHSVLYRAGSFNILDGRLGQHLSAGCVRLQIDNAKWIHDTIPTGTTVVSY